MLLRRLGRWPAWGSVNPFEELARMRRQMEWLDSSLGRDLLREPAAGVFPLLNVTEDKDKYYVRAELPGVKADELDISVTGDTLSISGERKLPAENENARYHRREREAGKFGRIVNLPDQLDAERVEARCGDGILTVILPKGEAAKPKQISVTAS